MGVTKKSQGHIMQKNSTNRKVCKVCSSKHPATLHGLVLKKGNSEENSKSRKSKKLLKSRMYQGIIKI